MNREWAPGDVALVRVKKQWYRALRDRVGWIVATDDAHSDHLETCAGVNYECRPLAVIDPENGEQVERLVLGLARRRWGSRDLGGLPGIADEMQAALREYVDPKPEEPTGRWARVLDVDGIEWCRTEWDDGFNKPWQHEGTHAHWQTVAAVKVLSEGVTE